MKKFITNSALFLVILIVILQIRPLYLLNNDRYKLTVTGTEIYESIFKSKQKKKVKKILFGDSVGNQLFPNTKFSDTLNSMACNQSIGMVGQYILLNNYLKTGNQVDTVFMLFSPFSFQNNLDQVYTYHYFLKPFYIEEYMPLFTETVNDQIQKIPYHRFCRLPLILTSNWAPEYYSNDKLDYTFLSPISVEYLLKIKELSIKYHFSLIILPTPTSIIKKPLVEKMDKSEITKNNLETEFRDYFTNILYLDDTIFLDGTHFKKVKKYTDYYKKRFIKY